MAEQSALNRKHDSDTIEVCSQSFRTAVLARAFGTVAVYINDSLTREKTATAGIVSLMQNGNLLQNSNRELI